MNIYLVQHSTKMGSAIDGTACFSRENACRRITELSSQRVDELSEHIPDAHVNVIGDDRAEVFINDTRMEVFELLTVASEPLDSTVEDMLSGEAFPICCLSKADLEEHGFDTSNVTDNQMRYLARKLGDDYVEQMYWGSLDILAERADIPYKHDDPLSQMLPQDGSEVDISDRDDAPSWTFRDDDGNAYTDRATAVRLRDDKVEVRWEGERCSPANWEPLEWIEDDDDYDDFKDGLTECVKYALDEDE